MSLALTDEPAAISTISDSACALRAAAPPDTRPAAPRGPHQAAGFAPPLPGLDVFAGQQHVLTRRGGFEHLDLVLGDRLGVLQHDDRVCGVGDHAARVDE